MRIPKLNQWDIVRIEWADPHGLPGEWQKPSTKDMSITGCVTVGQVYQVYPDRVTVVCTWDLELKNAHGGMTVPYVLMTKLEILRRAEP